MALIKCPECGKEVSDTQEKCISCGYTLGTIIEKNENGDIELLSICNAICLVLKQNDFIDNKITRKLDNIKSLKDVGSRNIESRKWLISNMLYILKNITLENTKKASTNYQEDYEQIMYYLNLNNTIKTQKKDGKVSYPFSSSFIYLIMKENNISEQAVQDYGKISDEEWCVKYLNEFNKIKREFFTNYVEDVDEAYTYFINEYILKLKKSNKKILEKIYKQKLSYIVEEAFNTLQPTKDDYFGAIDICDYLENQYNFQGKMYDFCQLIDDFLSKCKKAIMLYGDKPQGDGFKLDDGRILYYCCYFYSQDDILTTRFGTKRRLNEWTSEIIEKLNKNVEQDINEALDFLEVIKKESHGDPISDLDFSINDVKKARELRIEQIHKFEEDDEEYSKIESQKVEYEKRNSNIQKEIEEVKNEPGIKCPSCGSRNVQKVSSINRAKSIFFWGLASDKIGKTRECKNCGYKW